MTAGRNTDKPAKKQAKRAAKKPAPAKAAAKDKPRKGQMLPPRDEHAELHPDDPDAHLVAQAERGREASEVKDLVAGLSEDIVRQYGTLSKREVAFVEAYLELRHATPAAVKAGYSKSYAHSFAGRLLNKPVIRAVIQEIDRVNFSALQINAQSVIEGLHREAQTAFEGSARVKAWTALGEIFEVFPAKRVKHSLADPLVEALRESMNAADGAGTGLPPPEKDGHGPRAH